MAHRRLLPDLIHHIRPDEGQEFAHLMHVIFQRRAGHHQDPLGLVVKPADMLRPLRGRIFDVVRFVDHEKAEAQVVVDPVHDPAHGFVIGHGGAAFVEPRREGIFQPCAVQEMHRNRAEFPYFTAPVDEHRRRADDEETAGGIIFMQMNHRRDCLNRLAKPHLVAEKNPPLVQNILRPELLVRAQIPQKAAKVQRLARNFRGHRLRNAAVNERLPDRRARQPLQQRVICGGVLLKIRKGLRVTHIFRFFVPGNGLLTGPELLTLPIIPKQVQRYGSLLFRRGK